MENTTGAEAMPVEYIHMTRDDYERLLEDSGVTLRVKFGGTAQQSGCIGTGQVLPASTLGNNFFNTTHCRPLFLTIGTENASVSRNPDGHHMAAQNQNAGPFGTSAHDMSSGTAQFLPDMVGEIWIQQEMVTIPVNGVFSTETQGLWEPDRNSLKLLKQLGEGAFGVVFEGLLNKTTPVAIKTFKDGTMKEDFIKEAQIMTALDHPKLVKLHGVCSLGERFLIVTELVKHGSLLDYLKGNKEALNIRNLIDMATQIASGMAYLETRKCIHRDLAARNILVGEKLQVKIADFGLARLIKEDVYRAHLETKFPWRWTAPEAALRYEFSIKSDVWSFGILLFELVTYGETPYPDKKDFHSLLREIENGYRMPRPPGCPEALYKIMCKTWSLNPIERPSFETLEEGLELQRKLYSSSLSNIFT